MSNVRKLSGKLDTKAKEELGEVPERVDEDLVILKQWLVKQPHITPRLDDQFLIAFLRGCKFSTERVKEKFDMYYSIRTGIPEFFSNRDSLNEKLQYVMKLGVSLPLPQTEDEDSARLMLIRMGVYDPSKVSIADVMKVCYMITDLLLWIDDNTTIAGHTILVDLRGLTIGHLTNISPSLIKKMTSSIQEAYPIRQKGMHFVNPSAGFDALFKIFHGFLSKKIQERMHVHDSFDALHKHVPKRLLPEEYGGDVGPVQKIADYWQKILIDKSDWFADDAKYKTDEKKRPGRPKIDNIFGTDGSFRKLNVD